MENERENKINERKTPVWETTAREIPRPCDSENEDASFSVFCARRLAHGLWKTNESGGGKGKTTWSNQRRHGIALSSHVPVIQLDVASDQTMSGSVDEAREPGMFKGQ